MVKKAVKLSIVLLLIISNVFIFSGCGKKNNNNTGKPEDGKDVYEAPLRNYMEGLKTKNIEVLLSAFPEFMQKMTQTDIDTVYAEYEAQYGSNIVMEYKLGDATRVTEDYDLEILASQIKEYYPDAGDIKITDAYIITVELSISGDGKAEQNEDGENKEEKPSKKTDSQDFYVYKMNDKWYMF